MFRLGTVFMGWFFLLGTWIFPLANAADFSWITGTDIGVPLLNLQDADVGVVRDGPNLYLQTAFYPKWSRFRGTNLDDLVPIADAERDESFTQPNGDDAYWTNAIWKDAGGKYHAIIHIEYSYAVPRKASHWKRRIGLATSTDQGAHWHYEGDILTTPSVPSGPLADLQNFGCGDTYLCVDRRGGFFYLYYMTAWVDPATGQRARQAINVARCPINGKMAPGQWKKWSDSSWDQPGLGGTEEAVFFSTDSAVVHFNTYLNTFVAIGRDSDNRCWISTADSLAIQSWKQRDYSFPDRLYWYNWPIDPFTNDRYEIGQHLRLYSAQANVDGKGAKYFNLTFLKKAAAAPPSPKK